MRTVYVAADPFEAEILKAYLAEHRIAVTVFGSYAWSGRGDLPVDIYPRLQLQDERDHDRARQLLEQYEQRAHEHSIWRCSCGEPCPLHFESCWNCGKDRPQ
ncbi:MAG: DUF2007 domain-containing protein [Stenotrophobium sp.]